MRIVGISGSLRRDSYNRALLRAAARELPPEAALIAWDGLGALPVFDEDLECAPPRAVLEFRAAIAECDAVLIATPEYNASVPGGLKNALDWASRPFPDNVLRDKPCAVIGASTGLFGAVWAQAEIRKALAYSGAKVVDAELAVGMAEDALAGGNRLMDPDLALRLHALLDELIAATAAIVAERR